MKLRVLGLRELELNRDGEGKLFHLSDIPIKRREVFRNLSDESLRQRPWMAMAVFDRETWLMTIQIYGKEDLYSIYYCSFGANVEPILFKDYIISDLNTRWLGITGLGDLGEILYIPGKTSYNVITDEIVSTSRQDIYPQDSDNTKLSTGGTMYRILPKNLWMSERADLSKIIREMNGIVRSESIDWMQSLLLKSFGWEPSKTYLHTGYSTYPEKYLGIRIFEEGGVNSGFFKFGVITDDVIGVDNSLSDILKFENKVLPKQIN